MRLTVEAGFLGGAVFGTAASLLAASCIALAADCIAEAACWNEALETELPAAVNTPVGVVICC